VKVPGRSGLEVRAQRGYFGRAAATKRPGSNKKEAAPAAGPNPLRDALVSLMPRQDLKVDVAAGYADTDAGPTVVVATRVRPAPGAGAAGAGPRTVEVLGVIYDEEGQPLANFNERQDLAGGDHVTFDTHTTLAPGRYQVRVAAGDGGRFGTTSLWTEVPDLAQGAFVLTDVFAIEGDTPPRPVRSGQAFSRQTPLELTLFACNPKGDTARHADVLFKAALLSGDRVVLEEPPFTVTVPAAEPRPRRVGFSQTLALAALDPGAYTLRIQVVDQIAQATLDRVLEFRVE
jgi:hypothetical protein